MFDWYNYVIIPLLIFIARVLDVSIGTVRLIFISKGLKKWAAILGFIEITIWLTAISQIFNNLTNIFAFLGYALGFATGNYVGILIEEKLSFGKVLVRIITGRDSSKLLKELNKKKYTFTTLGADGPDGKVKLIMTIIHRKDLKKVLNIIHEANPHAFYTVEDIRHVNDVNGLNIKQTARQTTYKRK